VTAFYIDWSDIQLGLASPSGLAYAANAGKAVNHGVEGTGTFRPIPNLTLQANLTYLDATLREDFDPGAGQPIVPAGSVLPGSSKWQVSDSASYTWDTVPFAPTLTLLHRFVSKAPGPFSPAFAVTQGGYNVFDLRLSGQFHGAEITAFVQNIGDVRGVATVSAFAGSPWERYLIRPRTIGLTFDYKM
jgi:outer membrane receptor protein involved in Fe transport